MTVNDRKSGGPAGAEERDPRIDRLYREAERSEPPAHVDAAILAAARREVGSRPRALSSAVRRWRVPVSIAALVVLSVSLVTLVQHEGGGDLVPVDSGPPPAPKQSDKAPPPEAAAAQPDAERRSVAVPAARPRAAPPAPRVDKLAGAREEVGALSDSLRRDAVTGPASGAGSASVAEPAARPAPQAFPAPQRTEEREAVSPQAVPEAPETAVRPSAVQAERKARSADAGVPPAAPMRSMEAARERATAWRGYEKEPPQKWLERIAELRRLGETVLANEMVAEFKRRFPDQSVPAELDRR